MKYIITMLMLFSAEVWGQEAKWDSVMYKPISISIDTTIAISGAKTELDTVFCYKNIFSRVVYDSIFSAKSGIDVSFMVLDTVLIYKTEPKTLCYFKYFRTESAEIIYDDSIFACPVCHKFAEHEPIPVEFYGDPRSYMGSVYNPQVICPFCNNIYRGRWIKRIVKK